MDYYERKRKAQILIKDLLSKKVDNETIIFAVEDSYQLGKAWTIKFIEALKMRE